MIYTVGIFATLLGIYTIIESIHGLIKVKEIKRSIK